MAPRHSEHSGIGHTLQGTQRLSTRLGKHGYSFLSLAWLNAHWAPHSPRNPSHVQKLTYQDTCTLTKTHTQGHTHTGTQVHVYKHIFVTN